MRDQTPPLGLHRFAALTATATFLRTATATNMGLDKVSVYQRVMDYAILTKPRMVVMILAVTVAGFYMGTTGTPDWAGTESFAWCVSGFRRRLDAQSIL